MKLTSLGKMQACTERNHGSPNCLCRVLSLGRLWMLLGLLGAVSLSCYGVYDYVWGVPELNELLLQESDTELVAPKLSQERSNTNYQYKMFAIAFVVVLCLCVYYIASKSEEEDSQRAKEMHKEQVLQKMHGFSHNLERQLLVSDAEKRKKTSKHEADMKSLRHRHEQELSSKKKTIYRRNSKPERGL